MTNQCTQNTQGVRYICHKCAYIKSSAELTYYGSYRLCRECARKFEEFREKDKFNNVETYVMAE
jgi:hypothetical protein